MAGLTPDHLDGAQRALYEQIVSGPRSAGPQHFPLVDATGALTGPFGIMLHVPEIGRSLQDLGAAIRYRTSLTARVREIAILSVAAATSCEFEAYAHERVGRAAGLTELEIESLARGEFEGIDPVEVAAYRLCGLLNQDWLPVDESEFIDLRTPLGESTLIELVVLVGYYRTLAQLLNLFDIGVPPGD
ncbi:carboxymuconolactone decarboxylase family protein [Streptomyces sp. CA-179760]|uniref:carboxymuconolactone decarboxylase family protein n=1 Tax=Streptomyces sp. CA-179760 TaxID=3240054 RepID=UPI003D923F69